MTDRDKEVIRLYVEQKQPMKEIATTLNYSSRYKVWKVLNQYGIERRVTNRKHDFNFSYFKTIDTESKAYILGFLYADGYNSHEGFVINLHEQDKDILEKIKKELKYEGNLFYRIKDNAANQFTLQVRSLEISKDLSRLGCVKKKSLVLKFPTEEQVPTNLIRHFIRGYFDGDGSLFFTKSYNANVTSTKEFLTGIQQTLLPVVNLYTTKLSQCTPNKNTFKLKINGNRNVSMFLDWLYEDATIYLDRKYKKYQEFKNYCHTFFIEQLQKKDFSKNKMCVTPNCYNVTYSNKDICKSCFYNRKPTKCNYVI